MWQAMSGLFCCLWVWLANPRHSASACVCVGMGVWAGFCRLWRTRVLRRYIGWFPSLACKTPLEPASSCAPSRRLGDGRRSLWKMHALREDSVVRTSPGAPRPILGCRLPLPLYAKPVSQPAMSVRCIYVCVCFSG